MGNFPCDVSWDMASCQKADGITNIFGGRGHVQWGNHNLAKHVKMPAGFAGERTRQKMSLGKLVLGLKSNVKGRRVSTASSIHQIPSCGTKCWAYVGPEEQMAYQPSTKHLRMELVKDERTLARTKGT